MISVSIKEAACSLRWGFEINLIATGRVTFEK